MNTKQRWNRIRVLKSGSTAGFTLVELIVVIAILAILAGIAVPAYSGYIKKANKAADLQLLGAVNTAFAAACLENGMDVTDVDEAGIEKAAVPATFARTTATTEGTGWRVGGAWAKVDGAAIAGFNETFLRYYGEENTGTFKVMTGLIFDVEKHMFVDPDSTSGVTVGYGGAKVTITSEQIQLLKDSSFYGEGMTSAGLLQQVDNVAVVANGMGTIQNIMETPEFGAYALSALGVTSQTELEAKVDKIAFEKAGLPADFDITNATEEEYNKYAAAKDQIYGNALVLYTAQQTTNMGDSAKTLLNGITSTQISQNMYGATAEQQQTGVNQAALAYGMYYAYVNSNACTDSDIKGNANITPNDVITALDSNTEFQAYMTSPQGQKDMEAYLEALSVVNSGAQTPGAVENLLTNGFVDLNDLLTGTMGK